MTTVHPSIYHDELLMLDEYTEKVTATFGRQFEADRALAQDRRADHRQVQ